MPTQRKPDKLYARALKRVVCSYLRFTMLFTMSIRQGATVSVVFCDNQPVSIHTWVLRFYDQSRGFRTFPGHIAWAQTTLMSSRPSALFNLKNVFVTQPIREQWCSNSL